MKSSFIVNFFTFFYPVIDFTKLVIKKLIDFSHSRTILLQWPGINSAAT